MIKPLALFGLSLATLSPAFSTNAEAVDTLIAQKMMIDIRYFCEQATTDAQPCTTPVTQLPNVLRELITDTNLGGVILFSENLVDIPQIASLTHDLQQAALAGTAKSPLLISIDQEGGRVARLPRELSTSFTGNMSIGATYGAFSDTYASQSGRIIAKELSALGINVNHAPNVDVNVNPNNPVINVRSFGEDPSVVARLGAAQVNAMQQHNVIATIKHFPGHGDTHIDSHTGLPLVNHDLKTIETVDLLPFKEIIATANPGMIMTAHIQYPYLDDSTFVAKTGETMVKPATMSKKILTELLRNKMKYQGVVITDALDMKGISDFFSPTQAVLHTFKAGADIALMPLAIRTPKDVVAFKSLVKDIANAVHRKELNIQDLQSSVARIWALKNKFKLAELAERPLEQQIANANLIVGNTEHKRVEQELADNALTLVKNEGNTLPLRDLNLHIIMPDQAKCTTLSFYLQKYTAPHVKLTCSSLVSLNLKDEKRNIDNASTVIFGFISPNQSAVEMGGMDDLSKLPSPYNNDQARSYLLMLQQYTKRADKKIVYVSLRAPYDISTLGVLADAVLATYAYNSYPSRDEQTMESAALNALAKALVQPKVFTGSLPVTINHKQLAGMATRNLN